MLTGSPGEPSDGSFEAHVAAWTGDLSRLAYVLTGDHHAADDIVADALLAAWKRWPAVMAAGNPRAYVRRIVVNLAATRVRNLVRDRTRLRLVAVLASEAAPAPDTSAVMDLRDALEALPRGQRVCVCLRYGMEMSEAEVADVLKISVGTVKSQTSKGAKRLRQLLEPVASP